MQDVLLSQVIFSPGALALQLCEGLRRLGHDITLYSPGPISTTVTNITSNATLFERELELRGDSYIDLLKKHPFTFVTLARQLQGEVISKAYQDANDGKLDIVHMYTNEEELGLSFANLCQKPVVFTHHDPFNFLIKYKNNFPNHAQLNWISISHAQRATMPSNTNWIANIYHGFDDSYYEPVQSPSGDYVVFLGRIIRPKGLHLAIQAVQKYNRNHTKKPLILKIAGKHYGDEANDSYWQTEIAPHLHDPTIEYLGFISDSKEKAALLANAKALVMPSLFDEPFGMVAIESLACAIPVIGLDSGALPEVIRTGKTGYIVEKSHIEDGVVDNQQTAKQLSEALTKIDTISRAACREEYLQRFTAERMCRDYAATYAKVIESQDQS